MRQSSAIKKEIIEEIKDLPVQQQKKILDMLRILKAGGKVSQRKHDITELRGCGKKIWKGIDAQTYVNKLRAEWN